MSLQARILIAEDEALLRNLVRMSLEATGHHVTTVNDGQSIHVPSSDEVML
jgi:CheY-like chemotaxis protein